jgi:hypothetical protein
MGDNTDNRDSIDTGKNEDGYNIIYISLLFLCYHISHNL